MDVDGGEEEVLDGAGAMLRTGQVRWLIETHSADLERACARRLTEHGYRVVLVRNAWWRALVPEQRPSSHNRWLVALPLDSK
jgi:hypothetical protein